MYPNPQEALPLPKRPNIEQYKKLAKDLVKACKSGDPEAVRVWAVRWLEKLAALQDASQSGLQHEKEIGALVDRIQQFALKTLTGTDEATCALSDAQFVIARAHGFLSWPKFVRHVESLASPRSTVSAFERAVTAIVTGDTVTLKRVLADHPNLVRARSTREHRATLLHYISANGVEGYRQVSPGNAAEIAEILLAAGADVDAEADVYEGRCTPLGLVATSSPPYAAGVQHQVMAVLLNHGARLHLRGAAGRAHGLVRSCLLNGQPEAAEHLANRGAPVDFAEAAGLGRLDLLKALFSDRTPGLKKTRKEMLDAFALACTYGRVQVVDFFLDHGFEVDAELCIHGDGHTGLHVAAYHAHLDLVKTLLQRGAGIDAIDKTWGTTPLIWALTGWDQHTGEQESKYGEVVARLVAAGANVPTDVIGWAKAHPNSKMLLALTNESKTDE